MLQEPKKTADFPHLWFYTPTYAQYANFIILNGVDDGALDIRRQPRRKNSRQSASWRAMKGPKRCRRDISLSWI